MFIDAKFLGHALILEVGKWHPIGDSAPSFRPAQQ
jgi:hypothetical protein